MKTCSYINSCLCVHRMDAQALAVDEGLTQLRDMDAKTKQLDQQVPVVVSWRAEPIILLSDNTCLVSS